MCRAYYYVAQPTSHTRRLATRAKRLQRVGDRARRSPTVACPCAMRKGMRDRAGGRACIVLLSLLPRQGSQVWSPLVAALDVPRLAAHNELGREAGD